MISVQLLTSVLVILIYTLIALGSVIVGVFSNIVSNVLAVLLRPEIANFADPQTTWLALASTLAANLTVLGSAATLIVAELAQANNAQLTFMKYLRAGVPITLLTMPFGIFWLEWVR